MTGGNEPGPQLAPVLAEEFRRLCGELQIAFAFAKSVLITAPVGGEGTTTIAVNLARALAENQQQRVLLVDANGRAPALHRLFGLEPAGGVRDWDGQSRPLYKSTHVAPNLFVLTAGIGDETVLGEQPAKLRLLAKQVREKFDFVVWDSPPITRNSDAFILATVVDGVLVVVEADRTRIDTLEFVREQLTRVDAKLLGAVMNRKGRFLPRALRDSYES